MNSIHDLVLPLLYRSQKLSTLFPLFRSPLSIVYLRYHFIRNRLILLFILTIVLLKSFAYARRKRSAKNNTGG